MSLIRQNAIFCVIALGVCITATTGRAQSRARITHFDASGAGTDSGQGTYPAFMNPAGVIVGQYIDAYGVYHGFARSPDGSIAAFEAPDAGTGQGQGTLPWSINQAGEITGYYTDAAGLSHGFLRTREGDFVSFDAPGAGNGGCSPPVICSNGTQGAAINQESTISGQYVDNNGVFHGFVRSSGGNITTFNAPGAGTGPGQGTFVTFGDGINPEGVIAGGYADANGTFHGSIRAPDGKFTIFDPPGSVFTDNSGINAHGTVMSFYIDANGTFHGYVRPPNGTFKFFDVSGAGTGNGQGTEPLNINAPGDIVGAYIDASGVDHGFLRTKDGTITKFDISGAGTGSGQGTIPDCNNPADAITGFYIDASGVGHGFLRTP